MPIFRRTKNYYTYGSLDQLESNIVSRLDHGLVEMGAYTPIEFNSSSSGYVNLEPSFQKSLGGEGRVFETFGPSLVWQEGASVPSGLTSPFRPSGVWVDDVFYSTSGSNGSYSHRFDYRNGRVIFDSSIGISSKVQAEYCLNDVAVYTTDSKQWKTVVGDYSDRFVNIGNQQPSGLSSLLKENRVWLPCVFVEVGSSDSSRGLQLGGGQIDEVDLTYHIFADRPFDRKNLVNILHEDQFKKLSLYDINSAPFPLGYDGSFNPNAIEYPTLASPDGQYFWSHAYVSTSSADSFDDSPEIYRGEVRQTVEIMRYIGTY